MIQENYEELTDEEKMINNYFSIKNLVPESYEDFSDDELVNVKDSLTDIKDEIIEIKDTVTSKKDNTRLFAIINGIFLLTEIVLLSVLSVGTTILACAIVLNSISECLFLNQYFSNKKIANQSEKLIKFIDEEQEIISQKLLDNYNKKIEQENKNLPKYMANNRARYEYEEEQENFNEDKNEFSM